MLRIEIPGHEPWELRFLVCDLNGTLALDGHIVPGVGERLARLSGVLAIHMLTAGTHGGLEQAQAVLAAACHEAGAVAPHWQRVATGADKARIVAGLGAEAVAVLGNGANDEPMFRLARLSIGILGGEGAYMATLVAAHVVTATPLDALDLLLRPARLIATLRR